MALSPEVIPTSTVTDSGTCGTTYHHRLSFRYLRRPCVSKTKADHKGACRVECWRVQCQVQPHLPPYVSHRLHQVPRGHHHWSIFIGGEFLPVLLRPATNSVYNLTESHDKYTLNTRLSTWLMQIYSRNNSADGLTCPQHRNCATADDMGVKGT